jgi:sulfide:quinone oxidoreductase
MPLDAGTTRPRVVVAGAGVAGLETCLALRHHLTADDLDIALLAPTERFEYRPLAVLEPFKGVSRWSMALASFAADQDVELVRDALVAVAPHARTAATGSGHDLAYDVLVVAIGGHAVNTIPGALAFRGPRDGHILRTLLDGEPRSLIFAVPVGATWPLPVYELALMSAATLRRAGAVTTVAVVTPESAPLALFGEEASYLVAELLADRGVEVRTSAHAVCARDGWLELDDGSELDAEHVVCLPRIIGRRIDGVPHDHEDFVPIDDHCRVVGVDHVYAAGDVANFPVKHGGLAAQQADAAADAILTDLGVPVAAQTFDPIIQGVLLTGTGSAHLRQPLGGRSGVRAQSLWWPPMKIAGRHLATHLITRAGLPPIPEASAGESQIPVTVDARDVVRGVRAVVGANLVPPG